MIKSNPQKILSSELSYSEQGKTTVIAMLLCNCALVFYVKIGRAFLAEHTLFPHAELLIPITLFVIALFTIGFVVHMTVIGDPSGGKLRNKVLHELSALHALCIQCGKQIQLLEKTLEELTVDLSLHSTSDLNTARRIFSALLRRHEEVEDLVKSKNGLALAQAYEIIHTPLEIEDSCWTGLIQTAPIPDIEVSEILPRLSKLFQAIHWEISEYKKYIQPPKRASQTAG